MPGIFVSGDRWFVYIMFERELDKLVSILIDIIPSMKVFERLTIWLQIMMGSIDIGSTSCINNTFKILYKLNILAEWGISTYKDWFTDNILS